MGLITAWFDRTLRGRAAGFVVIGSGFAIIISGKLIPEVNKAIGPEGWRTNWLVLAILVTLIAVVGHVFLRNRPEERGLEPLGGEGKAMASVPQSPTAQKHLYEQDALLLG
jgi:sugar phosphate permease